MRPCTPRSGGCGFDSRREVGSLFTILGLPRQAREGSRERASVPFLEYTNAFVDEIGKPARRIGNPMCYCNELKKWTKNGLCSNCARKSLQISTKAVADRLRIQAALLVLLSHQPGFPRIRCESLSNQALAPVAADRAMLEESASNRS
jgi:hypothetical protein